MNCYGFGGVHKAGSIYEGLKRQEMVELCQNIIIDNSKFDSMESGWFKKQEVETKEEMIQRVKLVISELKQHHKSRPNETILMISHGSFLKQLMLMLTD
jgi:broad specificity phosphatase PhoE